MINYSIIIPHHNIPTLLQRCLDSIPEREDIQIIVVDDNSNPNTVDFKRFPGIGRKNVEIYYTKEGKGAGFARNIGLEHAKGKYLIFSDADDYFYPELIYVCDKYLHSGADLIFLGVNSRNSDTLELSQDFRASELEKFKLNAIERNNLELLRWNNKDVLNVPWGKMVKRSLVQENAICFDEVLAGNDAMFSLKSALKAETILVDQTAVYCVTTRQGSLTQTVNKSIMKSRWGVACRINQELYRQNLPELRYNLFIVQRRYFGSFMKEYFNAFKDIINVTPIRFVFADFCKLCYMIVQKILKL